MARILLCCMNYRPEMISTGKYAFELAEYLESQGHSVEVVTTAPHYPGWRAFAPYSNRRYYSELVCGVRVWRCPMALMSSASGLGRLMMPLSWAITSAPVLLWRAIRTRPDIMIMVQPTMFTGPFFLFAAFLAKSRKVMHVQDLEIDTAIAVGHLGASRVLVALAHAFERAILRRFDAIVTISNQMRQRLVSKGVDSRAIAVVRNWVDLEKIKPLDRPSLYRTQLHIAPDAFVVQYSGQWGRKQALHLLIETATQMEDDSRFVFIVAGDGPMRSELEAAERRLSNLKLLPLQPTEQMGEFLALGDCHILPQEKDVSELVLPSKLGGMLASGKRILVTADTDSELYSFLGNGSADFVPPGDAQAVVDALRHMAQLPDEKRNERGLRAKELDHQHLLPLFESIIIKK
jgi:colanic acid biosynthesis glycosyl transferase WcaI